MMKIVNSIFKTFLLSIFIIAQVNVIRAQNAAILPPAKTTFFDSNGKPLTSGTVDFYIPSTTTRKNTWQDFARTTLNTNPVVLDGAGRGLILGLGSYRQVVKDRVGNIIWDQVTANGNGGADQPIQTGDGDLVATIKPWAGMIAPNQYMFAYGQEVNRTTYAALFTAMTSSQSVFCSSGSPTLSGLTDTTNFPIGGNVEVSCITAGTSTIVSKTASTITLAVNAVVSTNPIAVIFPWGNGNHITTFNLPDLRGYVIAGNDNMGGSAAGRLTNSFFGTNPDAVNAAGGAQSSTNSITITTPNLPAYTPSGTVTSVVTDPGHHHTYNTWLNVVNQTGGGDFAEPSSATTPNTSTATTGITVASTFAGSAQGGTSTPLSLSLNTIQPTKTANYIIKVTPDQNSAIASGVTSLGLQTGDVACGAGLLCTGNIIQVTGSPVSSLVVGTTTITGGSNTNIFYNNAGVLGEYGLATNDQYNCAASGVLIQPSVVFEAETVTAFASNTLFDFCKFKNTAITLTGNITTQTFINVVPGKAGMITFIQDGTGSRTTVWSSVLKFTGGVIPTLTATPGAVDILTYSCRSATFCGASLLTDVR